MSRRFPGRFPASQARGLHRQRPKAGPGGTAGFPGAPSSQGVRGGAGGLRNLAVAGGFFPLRSSFLSRPPTLPLLPRSHPSLFPPLRRRVGSDVTSAEIPPNCTAQWRAGGGRAGLRGRAGASSALGPARGGGSRQGLREARQGREGAARGARGAGSPSRSAGERRREREPGRALRQEQRGSGRSRSRRGEEDAKGGWGAGGEKAARAKPGARGSQRGRAGASGSQEGTPGEPAGTGREAWAGRGPQETEQRTVCKGSLWGEACGV